MKFRVFLNGINDFLTNSTIVSRLETKGCHMMNLSKVDTTNIDDEISSYCIKRGHDIIARHHLR